MLSPISWFWAILQFRHRMSDESNIKVTNATCIDFLATPPCSPDIGTPDLPSPIRQIILNDRESEPTDSLDILPQILGTDSNIDNSHPPRNGIW